MAQISKQGLSVDNGISFPNNNSGQITPTALRNFNTNMIDSLVDENTYRPFTASVTSSLINLNAFTASQQPSFTALNSFTASQLTINTGYNSATQSLSSSIATTNTALNQVIAYTGSVNEIVSAGVLQGYSTRFYFSGLMTASIVANVGGPIAAISLLSDTTRVATSSFNPWSASVNVSLDNLNQFTASQISFNASATASISQLLSFSSSLDATYATDAQLNAVSASLVNSINTKLNTSSFNAYTQSNNIVISGLATTSSFNSYTSSQASSNTNTNLFTASINSYTASNDTKWITIGLLTGSYATTGSNTFIGNQTITGSTTITGSAYGNVVSMSIASQTASMNLTQGNFFTLTLVSGSTTHLAATNIRQGQTINLLISQPAIGTGSVTYNSTLKFPPANNYIPTSISGSKDIITFITFDNSTIYASAINNLV